MRRREKRKIKKELCNEEEIREICCTLQKNKCSDPDEIPYEAFINAGRGMLLTVTAMMEK